MKNIKKKILVTCALPYANGMIHIGHLLEYIQADIWVRFNKMLGHDVCFICADDSHGTAIMLNAKSLKISEEELIKNIRNKHIKDLKKFSISFNHYSSTHSQENKKICEKMYLRLKKKGFIKEMNVSQLYDPILNMFLSDRFVKGTCPFCLIENQFGDYCINCHSTYSSKELINPVSTLSNIKPIIKKSLNIFFNLPHFSNFLKRWIFSNTLQTSVLNKVQEWCISGLKLWSISREFPYFGFLIPGFLKKYFYVWFDAPLCYLSCFIEYCNLKKKNTFQEFWNLNSTAEVYHFIGKDIIYFHCLFWPAVLEALRFRKPTKIFVHGHVTLNGKKLSKSTGNFVSAYDWEKKLDVDSLRYYYASKLSNKIDDIEMNFEEYRNKINSELVNNLINFAARNSSFLKNYFSNFLSENLLDINLYNKFLSFKKKIEIEYEERKFNLVIKHVIVLSNIANKFFTDKKPWFLIKKKSNYNLVQQICSMGINLFRIIMTFLIPIIPNFIKKTESFLNSKLDWFNLDNPLLNHKINNFSFLYTRRITKEDLKNILKFC